MQNFETILFDQENGVGTLTLNRPDRMNGMTGARLRETYEALSEAAVNPDLRIIVLTGAGNSFCPGADLNFYTDGSSDASPEPRNPDYFHVATLLHEMPQVTVAAVNGACAGAGMEMV